MTGVRRVGHGGTLDPLATGLLPVFVGQATRLIEYLGEHRKSYTATVRLGVETDTNDAEGAVVTETPLPTLTVSDLDAALAPFRGEIMQIPPTYSAVKVGGVPAHRAARRGRPLAMAPRPATVHELAVDDWTPPLLRLRMTVATGTYVRAIARDLGVALGCGGTVTEMRRTPDWPRPGGRGPHAGGAGGRVYRGGGAGLEPGGLPGALSHALAANDAERRQLAGGRARSHAGRAGATDGSTHTGGESARGSCGRADAGSQRAGTVAAG